MVDEFRALGCTRLNIAFREGPYDWDALEASPPRSCARASRASGTSTHANTDIKRRAMLNPGDKAPDFTGRDQDGNTVKLSDLKGKPVVLWFYPKADTPG